uniref:DUF1700 domain-containing protein n=1 Tax=Carnobacterium sp. TaxID=48221 RepID=UPI0034504F0A
MRSYKDYCEKLNISLSRIPNQEKEEVIDYYLEYAVDAGYTSYEQMESKFGSPKNLAAKIYSEVSMKELENKNNDRKGNSIKALRIGLIALFSLPMAFPFIIASSAISFAFIISFFAILIALIVTIGSLGLTAVALFIKSFSFLIPFYPFLWLKSLGGSISLAAIVILSLISLFFVIKFSTRAIVVFISKVVERRTNHA